MGHVAVAISEAGAGSKSKLCASDRNQARMA
eukprot:COSAG01_NODE_5846_length_3999_cov_3.807179_3_plen_31_part_00